MARSVVLLFALAAAGFIATTAQSAVSRESRLIFASNRTGVWQIYSIRRSGTGLAQLTAGQRASRDPVPSPDGRFVLFRRDVGELWVARSDGRNARALSTTGYLVAAWAPDSRRVAFDGGGGITVVDVRTGRSAVVFRQRAVPVGWSRDGSVLYVHVSSGCDPSCSLLAVTLATGVARRLVENVRGPVLAADRRSIAYFDKPSQGDLRVVDVRTAADRLIAADVYATPLRWSPRGRYLALVDGRSADPLGELSEGILLADAVRGGVRTLTEDPAVRNVPPFAPAPWSRPAWSPSGDAIAYVGLGGIRVSTLVGGVRTVFDNARDGAEVADLAWAQSPRPARGRPAGTQALVQASPDELRLRAGVPSELAADGDRVAFLSCHNPAVWTPATQSVSWIGPNTCPHARFWNLGNLALSSVGTAFVAWSGGGNVQYLSMLVSRPNSVVSDEVGSGYLCCTGGRRAGTAVGQALGSGSLLVFSKWHVVCPSFNDASCAVSTGPQSVWLMRDRGTLGTCPNSFGTYTGPCSQLASSLGPLAPLSVDEQHVVLRQEGGRIDVVDAEGQLIRSFGFAPGEATAAEIDGRDLVVVVPGLLLHYSVDSGALLHSWPLPQVSSGGFCGAPVREQCADVRLRLEDVHDGLAAYLLDGSLHVLRLRDGADRIIDRATAARFGDTGLFYARDGDPPWPGRVRFLGLEEVTPTASASLIRPG